MARLSRLRRPRRNACAAGTRRERPPPSRLEPVRWNGHGNTTPDSSTDPAAGVRRSAHRGERLSRVARALPTNAAGLTHNGAGATDRQARSRTRSMSVGDTCRVGEQSTSSERLPTELGRPLLGRRQPTPEGGPNPGRYRSRGGRCPPFPGRAMPTKSAGCTPPAKCRRLAVQTRSPAAVALANR